MQSRQHNLFVPNLHNYNFLFASIQNNNNNTKNHNATLQTQRPSGNQLIVFKVSNSVGKIVLDKTDTTLRKKRKESAAIGRDLQ